MARPIEETPVLTGNDAKRFLKAMKAAEAGPLKVSDEEMAKIYSKSLQNLVNPAFGRYPKNTVN